MSFRMRKGIDGVIRTKMKNYLDSMNFCLIAFGLLLGVSGCDSGGKVEEKKIVEHVAKLVPKVAIAEIEAGACTYGIPF